MTDVEAGANRTRTLILVGVGIVALVALLMLVVLPAMTGDQADDEPEVVVIDESPVPAATPTEDFELAEPGEVEGDLPAETFEVFNARDPFQQLVEADADGVTGGPDGAPIVPPGGTGTGTTTDPGTGTGTPTDPGTTPGTTPGTATPPPDTSGDGSNGSGTDGNGSDGNGSDGNGTDGNGTDGNGTDGNGSDAQVGGTQVTLVDVFTDDDGERQATVTVNGTGYTVGEGDTFGRRFRLLDISGRCATMLFGDSRFTLCEGERIRK